jgi:hypothetical protein
VTELRPVNPENVVVFHAKVLSTERVVEMEPPPVKKPVTSRESAGSPNTSVLEKLMPRRLNAPPLP